MLQLDRYSAVVIPGDAYAPTQAPRQANYKKPQRGETHWLERYLNPAMLSWAHRFIAALPNGEVGAGLTEATTTFR